MSVSHARAVTVDAALAAAWPQTCLGCLRYTVEVRPQNPDMWIFYEAHVLEPLRARLEALPVTEMTGIADARAAYRAFGMDPGRHRVSSEALYRRVRQGKDLYRINSLVDVNNLVSLETGFSLGSYDDARIVEGVILRLGAPGEAYEGIGKARLALENMPLLADGHGPFGSPTSDGTRTMILPETRQGLTVIYGFSGRAATLAALEHARERFVRFAGVTDLTTFVV